MATGLFDALGSFLGGNPGSPLTQTGPTGPYGQAYTKYSDIVGSTGTGGTEQQIQDTATKYTGSAANAVNTGTTPSYYNWSTTYPGTQTLAKLLDPNNSAYTANVVQNLPGYQAATASKQQQNVRTGAQGGSAKSGAVEAANTKLLNTQAQQAYDDFIKQLQGQQTAATTSASTYAAPWSNLASIYGNTGTNLASNQTTLGQGLGSAGYASILGPATAQSQENYYDTNLGSGLVGGLIGAGTSLLSKKLTA
jgi:hypothetical protein